jgi:hypothetical protein
MKFRITMNGKQITPREAASDLLHPDRLAEKILTQRIAGLSCDQHPIQCQHLALKVVKGKMELQNLCCDAFRQKVLQALQTQGSPAGPGQ